MAANIILLLIGLICVINASVISINIYDGDNKLSQIHSVEDCDNISCDQTCRRIGFPGGICVEGHCKCDIMSNALTVVYKYKADKIPGPIAECDWATCNQRCSRRGFHGVICVGDKCQCTNYKPKPGENRLSQSQTLNDCDNTGCDQGCRRIGFPSGVCVGGHCKCDIMSNDVPVFGFTKADKTSVPVEDCDFSNCYQMCISMGFDSGICVGDNCQCDNLKPKRDLLNMLLSCHIAQCNDMCHRLNYAGGTCIGGSCECY